MQKLFVEPPPPVDTTPADPVHLLDLQPHHCRWPLGEAPELMFCGAAKYGEKPYCYAHCQRAYVQPKPR